MSEAVDLNSDLGEGAGYDGEILELITSANIACGFHAGDPASIFASICAARDKGVAVGAHPSFNDREHFGRQEMRIAPAELSSVLIYQLGAFRALCSAAGVTMTHVKPHGALYNIAWSDEQMAEIIARAVLAIDSSLVVFAQSRSALERACARLQLRTVAEVFADRAYMPDGSLVPRARAGALLRDAREAAGRAVGMVRETKVRAINGEEVSISAETICVHGDTPAAIEFARALRAQLESAAVIVRGASCSRSARAA